LSDEYVEEDGAELEKREVTKIWRIKSRRALSNTEEHKGMTRYLLGNEEN
jgi:hypothetical protein